MTKIRKAPRRFQSGGKYRMNSERILDGSSDRQALTREQGSKWEIPSNLRWRNVGDPTTTGVYGSGPLKQDVLLKQNFYDFVLDNPRASGIVYGDSAAVAREFEGEAGNHWRRYMAGPRDKAYEEFYAPGGAAYSKDKGSKSFLHKLFGL